MKPSEELIRTRAYQLWEKAGRPEGGAEEFWRQAEIELDAASENPDQPNSTTIPG